MEQEQILYLQEKRQFFGLCFCGADITITVLENVAKIMPEGDNLKHCIFTNEYFKKKDSLLISARIDNKPVETIEVSLFKMEIVQCRGMKNNISKHRKTIMVPMKKKSAKFVQEWKRKKL